MKDVFSSGDSSKKFKIAEGQWYRYAPSYVSPAYLLLEGFFFTNRRRHTDLQGDWSSDVCSFDPSRRRHTRLQGDWSSDVCSSDLHRRRHQVRARALALAPLEVAVGGGGHAFALTRGLAVHPHAHRAAGLAPLEAGLDEDAVEPFGLGGALDQPRARHDPRRHHGAASLHHSCGGAQ